ncbi:hypothetical protein [Mesorhizobium sp.]|uniref:hypothetical protein n=1 Tax=Mesorhizobium sp. TaxID=1871066 RepID=UPI000FE9FD71|nr:hypothetical protein [Mesorhizobium sp.]RWB57069.1 MAG: hypothetical protein EOQ47_10720 [Mesorhizobium sp.]
MIARAIGYVVAGPWHQTGKAPVEVDEAALRWLAAASTFAAFVGIVVLALLLNLTSPIGDTTDESRSQDIIIGRN